MSNQPEVEGVATLSLVPARSHMRREEAPNMRSPRHLADYATHLRAAGKPETTVRLRSWQLRRFAEQYTGSLTAVTTADLAAYLTRHDWSPATKYSVRATFKDFYRFLVKSGKVRHSPADGLPAIKVPRREPRPAPESVVRRAYEPRLQLMVDLAARQGLRRNEVALVSTRDLIPDATGWSLIVHGKGGKERTVPLHPDVAGRLLSAPPGWLFPSPNGGHLAVNYVGVLISNALGAGWSAHSLRRRFGTKVYAESHDIRAVQKLLGHADLSTTQMYVGMDSDQLRSAVGFAA